MAEFASRSDEIARALRDDILRGRYRSGERLPSERALAARTAANRGSVREALKKLEQQRLIEIRRGGGARVAPLNDASPDVLVHLLKLDDPPDPALVGQWIDVYELVAAGAMRLAVERANDAEIAEVRQLLARFADPSMGDQEFLRTTDEIAEVISAASRNLVLRMVRSTLRALFFQRFPSRRVRLRPPPEVLEPITAWLDQALARRDAPAAEEGVRRLLRSGRESLLKALEAHAARPA